MNIYCGQSAFWPENYYAVIRNGAFIGQFYTENDMNSYVQMMNRLEDNAQMQKTIRTENKQK